MERNPSIHVIEADLVVILDRIKHINQWKFDSNKLAKEVLRLSKGRSATNRSISISQQRVEKKVNKILKSDMGDAMLFSNLLTLIRRSVLKHKSFASIGEDHRDWVIIKELASHAFNFCKAYKLEKKEGFTKFITLGLNKMNKYNLIKLKGVAESIDQAYEAELNIQKDPNKELTERAHKIYMQTIIDKTGDMGYDYKNLPEKYVYFCEAVEVALKMGCEIEDYIKAQFHGLEWTKGIPDPVQLIGDKARERFIKYAYEFDIQTKKAKKEIPIIDWKKIKRHGKHSN